MTRVSWAALLLAATSLACANSDAPAKEASAEATAGERPDSAEAPASADTVVTLDSAAQRLAGIQLVTVTAGAGDELVANGTITYDANHVAVVAPRSEGRVVRLRADLGQRVRAGAVVAIVESPEVGQVRGELVSARARMEVAQKNYDREKRLFEQSITSQRELLAAEGEFRTAEADFASARGRLRALGADEGEGAAFGLATPVAGTVVERNANPGQVVGPSSNLFTVADLRHVWITVDVYESDLGRVRQGAKAAVVPTAVPGERFAGRVTYAGGVVDTTSRAFKVRVEVLNDDLRLRPGMFAQVRIQVPARGDTTEALAVPELAVQDLQGKWVAFVAGGVPGRFVARAVTVEPSSAGGMVRVTSGLKPGDRVVANGAFQLKAELTKASFGEEE
jgi:cobalt-zinc-cadmium efflux system membrane fusion protein